MLQTMRMVGVMWLISMMAGTNAVVQAQQAGTPQCVTLPANIEANTNMRRHVESLLAQSATLRQQCARIAAARNVRVVVRYVNPMPAYCRARAHMVRDADELRVLIDLPVSSSFAELLAHEFEHVLEAIEGVDLAALAREEDSGVSEILTGVFETRRAKSAGRRADVEVFTNRKARER